MSPPWACTSARAIANPSPVPPLDRVRARSARKKRSKTRAWSSGAIPMPVSRTWTSPRPCRWPTIDLNRAAGRGVPDGVIEQVAQICRMRAASPETVTGRSPLKVSASPAARAASSMDATTGCTVATRSRGWCSIVRAASSSRARSRRSSTSRLMPSSSWTILAISSRTAGDASGRRAISSALARTQCQRRA
ncbi:MAG: hypothetical protein KatS3mg059_0764 [Thermomicrobiales bacterium]|nr:MAG: hypothetical protein KatS3mg059_0764 [Thermomicrobiales bacterium]